MTTYSERLSLLLKLRIYSNKFTYKKYRVHIIKENKYYVAMNGRMAYIHRRDFKLPRDDGIWPLS